MLWNNFQKLRKAGCCRSRQLVGLQIAETQPPALPLIGYQAFNGWHRTSITYVGHQVSHFYIQSYELDGISHLQPEILLHLDI